MIFTARRLFRLRRTVRGATRLVGQIALAGGMPTVTGWSFRIGRRLHVVLPRPGEAVLRAKATALLPALLGGPATARMILAGERLAGIFGGRAGRQRQAQTGHQISKQRDAGTEPVLRSPPVVAHVAYHGANQARPNEFKR